MCVDSRFSFWHAMGKLGFPCGLDLLCNSVVKLFTGECVPFSCYGLHLV